MTSFLDNDFYNFNMSQYIWTYHQDTRVRYRFINRSKKKLKPSIPTWEFTKAIEELQDMKPSIEDILFLKTLGFHERFLNQLSESFACTIHFDIGNDEYDIWYEGPWWLAVFLETPLLAAINEVYVNNTGPGSLALTNLRHSIELLKIHPYVKVIEFGSRRRAGIGWQREALEKLKEDRPWQLLGTSNVMLSREFEIPVIGTMAHQLFMVNTAMWQNSAASAQNNILYNWMEMFPDQLTALPDTYSTDFFLRSLSTPERFAQEWNVRQDSGDPIAFARKVINFWRSYDVDLRSKVIAFSDGLDVQKMADIWGQFGHITNVNFGWGTNFTGGPRPISIVIKPEAVLVGEEWKPCCKLSDNIEKATGDPATIKELKGICGYKETYSQKATY